MAPGWVVLVVAGAALLAPIVVGRVAAGLGDRHRRIAAELGFVAVLLHQLTDGLALGAATGHGGYHWDLLIGIPAHTVPLVAMLTLTFAELGGRRAVLLRAAAMIAATAVGIGLTRLDDQLVPAAGPWLGAAIAGLLLHVLLHDSGDRAVPRATRPLEAVGVALGAALPFVAGGEHHPGFASALGANLATVVLGAAPWIVIGGGLAVLAAPGHRRAPMTLIRIVAGPITAVALIVVAYVATAVEDLGSVGAAAAAATSLVPRSHRAHRRDRARPPGPGAHCRARPPDLARHRPQPQPQPRPRADPRPRPRRGQRARAAPLVTSHLGWSG
jgi:hypothetical protein